MSAYYNEIDPYAADWLRNLIAAGHIAPGDVDTRSIADVSPDDLRGFTQCHFFAGIGVWSYALRRAGWDDDRPVWTGSCPCQPFSAAGRGEGFADERHLWPAFHHLISQCRPPVVFGEQVASKAVDPWIDLVQADMEAVDYAFGAIAFPAAGVGAPHIRDRTYFVADAHGRQQHGIAVLRGTERYGSDTGRSQGGGQLEPRRDDVVLADADSVTSGQWRSLDGGSDPRSDADARAGLRGGGRADVMGDALSARLEGQRRGHQAEIGHGSRAFRPASEAGELGGLADAGLPEQPGRDRASPDDDRCGGAGSFQGSEPAPRGASGGVAVAHGGELGEAGRLQRDELDGQQPQDGSAGRQGSGGIGHNSKPELDRPGPTNGLWRDADWLFCRDGKWRPVEPGTSPLAHGAPARVGRLRAYGNAICAEAAVEFIGAYEDASRRLAADARLARS